ncbi:ABC transporter permease [Neokomagataea anthophila]|uniref:ABC transporter permease n=1 Tax=Neokomagataea anthophila TaxID=2826925 RepID=A0ABS5E7E6_9PROT|nr:ABC transporter permease [Neokomagataea anthophila]MBR0559828.1 ABC transporter permease [Neokomagataea anthophila]
MFGTIIRSVARQAQRQPLYVGLNVFGLALGIGVFLTLVLLVRYEYSFNMDLADIQRVARVDAHWMMPGVEAKEYPESTFRAVPFLRQDFPEIESSTRLEENGVSLQKDGHFEEFDEGSVDPDFFKVFGVALRSGRVEGALSQPDSVVISEGAARKIFGTVDVLGRVVTLNHGEKNYAHTISGVLKNRSKPDFLTRYDFFMPITKNEEKQDCYIDWGGDCGAIYLKLHKPSQINVINAQLEQFIKQHAAGTDDFSIGPNPERIFALSLVGLDKTHFYDAHLQYAQDAINQNVVNSIGLIAALSLVLACVNTVNLATARSALRAREVALRKTFGATRKALFIQFMGEATCLVVFSAFIGLALSEILVPEIALITGKNVTIDYGFVCKILPIIIVACSVLSGIYPAVVLSGYRPSLIFAATRMASGGRFAERLRNSLTAGQFTIAVSLVICMLVIHHQTEFLRDANRGFAKEGLLIGHQIAADTLKTQKDILREIRNVQGVDFATLALLAPNPDRKSRTTFDYNAPTGTVRVHVLTDTVSTDYQKTYQPVLMAGRWFDLEHFEDVLPTGNGKRQRRTNAILNASAALKFGFHNVEDAVGKTINDGGGDVVIIGVIRDIRFESPHAAVYPSIIFFNPLSDNSLYLPIPAIRFHGVSEAVMKSRLEKAWYKVTPNIPSDFSDINERLSSYYEDDQRLGEVFTAGAVVALMIACLGLYGLASFAATRRVHEIGIRKTLGATGMQVIALLLRGFLKPVALACVIATPIAWVIMRSWLSGFDQRIALSAGDFIIAVLGAVIIATFTVIGQTYRISRAEPARALRAE